jgi:hypothetical protein
MKATGLCKEYFTIYRSFNTIAKGLQANKTPVIVSIEIKANTFQHHQQG